MTAIQPYPSENTWWPEVAYPEFRARYATVGRHWPDPSDPLTFVWPQRVAYDIRAGLTKEESLAKHLRDLDIALGIPQPIPPSRRIVGQLRVQGTAFADDQGVVLPIFCHFGEAFSAYVRRPDDVRQQLDVIVVAGYQGIRFWDVLGYYPAWAGREVTPIPFVGRDGRQVTATERYYDQLAAFLRDCQARSLVVQHSRGDLNAFTSSQLEQHCALVGDIQRSVGLQTVAVNEACNEAWQNGVPEPSTLKVMLERIGNPSTLEVSSAADDDYGGETGEAGVEEYTVDLGMDSHVVHGYRGGESEDRIRHIFSLTYEQLAKRGLTGWQGEPAGPGDGVSVGREEHPEALCLMAAMASAMGQGWVYMSGNGVFWNGPLESMTAFREVARMPSLLPADVMTWGAPFHGGSSWAAQRILEASGLRADHRVSADGRFIIVLYGPPGSYRVPVHRSFTGSILTPHTGESHPFSGQAGQSVDVSFERGRIVIGKVD